MTVAAFAMGLFAVAFVLHCIWWRVRRPRRPIIAMLLIFHGVLVAGLLAAPHVSGLTAYAPAGPWQVMHVCLFHVAFTLGYIVTYSALELDSPTLTITAYVAAAGKAGRSLDELLGLLREEQIVGARLDALTSAGIIARSQEGRCVLTPKGRRWALLFNAFRRLYRLNKGG